jgi:3-oxoacyl-[acyl-carrier protein] reductase
MLLNGKTAFVSGAGRNNGRAIALTFAREGAELVLIAQKRKEELEAVADECRKIGANVLPMLGDVTKQDDVARCTSAALAKFGKIDVLVNVVGVRPHKDLMELDYNEWKSVFDVNCHSLFLLAQAIIPSMKERRSGSIVALGGMAAMRPQPLGTAVVASKHALYGLIKSIALEYGPYGIRANLLNPGLTENVRMNPEWYRHLNGEPSSKEEIELTPLRRVASNQELANVALFLASDQSSYITGDRILHTGGRYIS